MDRKSTVAYITGVFDDRKMVLRPAGKDLMIAVTRNAKTRARLFRIRVARRKGRNRTRGRISSSSWFAIWVQCSASPQNSISAFAPEANAKDETKSELNLECSKRSHKGSTTVILFAFIATSSLQRFAGKSPIRLIFASAGGVWAAVTLASKDKWEGNYPNNSF